MKPICGLVLTLALFLFFNCSRTSEFDIVISNGTIYDGSGDPPYVGDVAIKGDEIVAVRNLSHYVTKTEIDASGMAVSPGFINMLSWATTSLIVDGNSQSDIRQGVTLEVFGEGWSMGPLNDKMKSEMKESQGDFKYDINWTTLGEYLDSLVARGISTNIASFVGATTVRIHELAYEDRAPTEQELGRMRDLVGQAMEEGALGVGSSLIYAPAYYAETDELIALATEAAKYGGMYISHMRNEGNRLLEALDELIRISRESRAPAEVYHLKAAGKSNWPKMDEVIRRIEAARAEGLKITADMYTYIAGATGLNATMPPWVQEGGYDAWVKRLKDPAIRKKVLGEMTSEPDGWENLLRLAGDASKVLLVGFRNEDLKSLTGKTLAEVAASRGKSAEETAIDLVIEDGSRVESVYFLMTEENVEKQIALPWVAFDSDAESLAPEGVFLKSNPHPRAYGNFARLLGRYVREKQIIPLEEAIRKLTSFPAENLKISRRGRLEPGYFADVVVFHPDEIIDHATFDDPHQYATGVEHVLVNGVQVLKDGEHTGMKPGRVVRGPGWAGSD